MTTRSSTVLPGMATLLLLTWGSPGAAQPVSIQFTANVVTVSGSPFGFTSTAGMQPVTGFFTYNRATTDTNVDPTRGDYPHASGGAFQAVVQNASLSRTITGSATPFAQVENLSSDTFRYIDGPRPVGPQGGIMSVNGTPNSAVQLLMAMTDSSGNAFTNDLLPATFPFAQPPLANPAPTFPHTFSLQDGGGTLLLQFNSLSPVPEPSAALLTLLGSAAYALACRRRAKVVPCATPG